MFWMALAVLVIVASLVVRRRRLDASTPDEPWRASLVESDDEPLDLEEIRRAEAEWESEFDAAEDPDDEEWS